MLPDVDGLEVCRRLRNMPQPMRSLPVLMLTAKGDPLDRVMAWSWAPMTTCRSLSSRASCWHACGRCCAAGSWLMPAVLRGRQQPGSRPPNRRCALAGSKSTPVRVSCGSTVPSGR